MSAEFQSIDEAINASYQSASQVETMARQLEARISKIDGASRHLPHYEAWQDREDQRNPKGLMSRLWRWASRQ